MVIIIVVIQNTYAKVHEVHINNTKLDGFVGEPSIGMPLPKNVSMTLTFVPTTFKTYM